jgi:hypothetical protein
VRIASDPTRRLLIDGAGLVERPLEVTPELTGWAAPTARAYTYRAGQVIDGEAEGDEMVMLLLRGDVDLAADGIVQRCVRVDPFADAAVVLYLAPGGAYRASVRADSHVLYCRAPAAGSRPTRILAPDAGELVTAEVAERLRIAEHRVGAGAWAALPFDVRGAVAYHRFVAPGGWALWPERAGAAVPEAAVVVRDGDALAVARERLELAVGPDADLLAVTVAAAPG